MHGEGIVHLEAEEEGKPEGAEKGDEAVESNLGGAGVRRNTSTAKRQCHMHAHARR